MRNRKHLQVRVVTIALLTTAGLVTPAAHSLASVTTPAAPIVISAPAVPTGNGPEDPGDDQDEDEPGTHADRGSDDDNGSEDSDDTPAGSGETRGSSDSGDGDQSGDDRSGDDGDDVPVLDIGGNGSADGHDHATPHKMSKKEKEAARKAAQKAAKEAQKRKEAERKAAKLAAEKQKKDAKKAAAAKKKAEKKAAEARKNAAKRAAKARKAAEARARAAARAQAQRSARADDDPDRGGDGRDSSDSFRETILDLSNRARHDAGCGSLKLGGNLNRSAQGKANDMARRHYMDHTSPNGKDFDDNIRASGYKGNKTGENLGEGFSSATAVFSAWMHSPSHRANILDCKFKVLGVGASDGYWVQHFGS